MDDRTLRLPEVGAVLRDEFSIDKQYRQGGTLVLVSVRQIETVLGVYPNLTGRPEFVFECGHSNTGTGSKPASYYHENCPTCGRFYCPACNYNNHDCKGCGEWLTHRTEHAHYKFEHADD